VINGNESGGHALLYRTSTLLAKSDTLLGIGGVACEVSHLAAHLFSEASNKSPQHSPLAAFFPRSGNPGHSLQHPFSRLSPNSAL